MNYTIETSAESVPELSRKQTTDRPGTLKKPWTGNVVNLN